MSHRQNISSRICQIANNFPATTSSLLTRPRTRHALRPFEFTDKRPGTKIYNPRSEADDSNAMYIEKLQSTSLHSLQDTLYIAWVGGYQLVTGSKREGKLHLAVIFMSSDLWPPSRLPRLGCRFSPAGCNDTHCALVST